MPRSKEMEKTRKVNKGPSALERVKADIEKRYGKGAIMDVSKEELDLTKVAEAFGGFIVEKKKRSARSLTGNIPPEERGVQPDADKIVKQRVKKAKVQQGELDFSNTMRDIEGDPQSKKIQKEIEKSTGQKTREFTQTDKNVTKGNELKQSPIKKKGTTKVKVTRSKAPTFNPKTGQGELALGNVSTQKPVKDIKNVSDLTGRTTPVTGERIRGRKPGSTVKKGTSFKQLRLKGTGVPVTSPKTGRVDLRTVNTKKRVTRKRPPYTGPRTASGQPILRKDIKRAVQGGIKTPADLGRQVQKSIKSVPSAKQVSKVTQKVAKGLTVGGAQKARTATKLVSKSVAKKTLGRAGAKFLAKQIPGLGTMISGGEAIARFATGDVVGGALSAAEMLPGLGLVAGAANVARDIGRVKGAAKVARKIPGIKRMIKPVSNIRRGYMRSKTAQGIRDMQRTAKKNPLATTAGGLGSTALVGTATRPRRGNLPRVPRPKLDQGVVGRRTAG